VPLISTWMSESRCKGPCCATNQTGTMTEFTKTCGHPCPSWSVCTEIHVPYETTQAVGFLDCRIALMLHPMLTTGVKLPGGARLAHRSLSREGPHTGVRAARIKFFILCWLLLFCSLLIDILWYLKQQAPRRPASEFASSVCFFNSLFTADYRTSHSFNLTTTLSFIPSIASRAYSSLLSRERGGSHTFA